MRGASASAYWVHQELGIILDEIMSIEGVTISRRVLIPRSYRQNAQWRLARVDAPTETPGRRRSA